MNESTPNLDEEPSSSKSETGSSQSPHKRMLVWFQTASGEWHWPSILTTVGWMFAGLLMAATLFVNWRDRQRTFETERVNRINAEALTARINDSERQLSEAKTRLANAEIRTQGVTRLPDGRSKIGSVVTGESTTLEEYFNTMQRAYGEGKFDVSFDAAKNAIRVYEETEKLMADVVFHTGNLVPESAATLYSRASHLATYFGNAEIRLEWAKKAHALAPIPGRKAELVAALLGAGETTEAQSLITKTLAEKGDDTEKFIGFLRKLGIPGRE